MTDPDPLDIPDIPEAGGVSEEIPADELVDVGDVPIVPEESHKVIEDEMPGNVELAFKFCFLGAGQAGGRLAHQFYTYGYRRVAAINTAPADLKLLKLPDENKQVIGDTSGAGGNPEIGRKAAEDNREAIHDLMLRCFGEKYDRVFVCASAGGGTGSGSCEEIVNIVHEMNERLELTDPEGDPRVGLIMALPRESDGPEAHATAHRTLSRILPMVPDKISPLILIDNQRIQKLYPDVPKLKFWGTANHTVCSIFHLLNMVAAKPSALTSFDAKDYQTILSSGILAFGAGPTGKWQGPDDIGESIRANIMRQALVGGVDISSASVAGCVIVAGQSILEQVPSSHFEKGYSMLARMINKDSTAAVRRGEYVGSKDQMVIYTVIGGLAAPSDRIAQLAKAGGIADHDGVV